MPTAPGLSASEKPPGTAGTPGAPPALDPHTAAGTSPDFAGDAAPRGPAPLVTQTQEPEQAPPDSVSWEDIVKVKREFDEEHEEAHAGYHALHRAQAQQTSMHALMRDALRRTPGGIYTEDEDGGITVWQLDVGARDGYRQMKPAKASDVFHQPNAFLPESVRSRVVEKAKTEGRGEQTGKAVQQQVPEEQQRAQQQRQEDEKMARVPTTADRAKAEPAPKSEEKK